MARPNRVRVRRTTPPFERITRVEADRRTRRLTLSIPDGLEYRYDVDLHVIERGLAGTGAAEIEPLLPGVLPDVESFAAHVYADALRAVGHRRARLRVRLA